MDAATFNALAKAAIARGDTTAIIYELESIKTEFKPISIGLDFSSFNQLKRSAVSHFEVAMLPPSKTWVALLTNELQTIVYGSRDFILDVASCAPDMPIESDDFD